MTLLTDTVAIPVVQGVDLNTAARQVNPPALLEAVNASFTRSGSRKRSGHVSVRARAGAYPVNTSQPMSTTPVLTPYGDKLLSGTFLYGWGENLDPVGGVDDRSINPQVLSLWPEAGYLLGGANRDNEVLGWNGFSLYSYAPGQTVSGLTTPACMPALRASPIAKTGTAKLNQTLPDIADNGRVRLVAWVDPTSQRVMYSIFDSATLAPLVLNKTLAGTGNVTNVRVLPMGSYIHLLSLDTNVRLHTIHDRVLDTVSVRSLGAAIFFDVFKRDETTAVIARITATGVQNVKLSSFEANGGVSHFITADTVFDIGAGDEAINLAITVHPTMDRVGMGWITTAASAANPKAVVGAQYLLTGIPLDGTTGAMVTLTGGQIDALTHTMGIASRYMQSAHDGDGNILLDLYVTLDDGAAGLTTYCFNFQRPDITTTTTKFHLRIASAAFRVGNRTFCWANNPGGVQSSWFLLDEVLNPVGRFCYGSAAGTVTSGGTPHPLVRSVNFRVTSDLKDVCAFHGGFGFQVRVPVTDAQTGVFTEPSILFAEVDFLPPLRSAQAGRCTYFAGAQVWCYDGLQLVESGFHLAPEFTAADAAGGSLSASQTYTYRVDLCHRNAQNEEVRSASFAVSHATTAGNKTINLTIKSRLTCRKDSYFLIFRNTIFAGAPTSTFNLLNSRDPTNAKYLKNDQSVASFTFTDDGTIYSDSAILNNELHPINAGPNYLQPFSPPACELIAAGRDRLWVAGGELLPGQVAPSRLFDPGEAPTFNATLWRQVDRSNEPVTAIGFVGDVGVFFRRRTTYLLEGDGPDNIASGFWAPARLALSDVGAVSQESLALISDGLCFQSETGIRILSAGGALGVIGKRVDPIASGDVFTCTGAVVVGKDQEVRWYSRTGAIVYNYLWGIWSTWTCGGFGVAKNPVTGHAVLLSGSEFLVETEGTYLDSESPYEHRIRLPWLHAGALGDFQRVKRFAGFGVWDPTQPHRVEVKIYYDEREFPEETWTWGVPDSTQNTDTWGAGSWGDGVWGDTASSSTHALRDSVWRWRRKPRRQKCSVFSISVSDAASTGPGFTITAMGLELGKKRGLDRIAPNTTTNTTR